MALTKVSGGILDPGIDVAGIVTATGFSGPFVGGSNGINAGIITCTELDLNGNGDISGNLVIGGNLTANGDFTTLNTTLREVELLRVDATSSTAAGIITQRGSGNILEFFDTSTNVGALTDEGNLGLGVNLTSPNVKLHVKSTATGGGNIAYFDDSGSGATGRLMILTTGGTASGDGIKFQTVNRRYTYFGNATNHLTIDNNNARIGIGTVSPAAKLDVNGTAKFNDDITLNGANFDITYDRSLNTVNFDQSFLKFGTSGQLVLRSSGSFSTIDSTAGLIMTVSSLEVKQTSGDKMIKTYNNGAVELYHDDHLSFTTNSNGITLNAPEGGDCVLDMNSDEGDDNPDKWRLNVTQGGSFQLKNYADGSWENHIQTTVNSSVQLYNNGNVKLETKGYGIDITGGFITTGGSIVNDGGNIKFGTHSDLQIFHDNSNNINVIQCHNGRTLHIDKDNGSENMAKFIPDGAVELYHGMGGSTGSSKKLETTTDGVTVTGSVRATGVNFPVGSTHLTFGHGGSFGELDNLTGNLRIKSGSINLANRYGNYNFIYCNASNSVDLYYDAANHSTPKLKTSATGITVTGEVAASQDYPQSDPNIDFVFTRAKKLDPRLTYRRSGTASYVDKNGMLKMVGDNVPRFDHDPLTKECKGLLLEPASSNRIHSSTHGIPNVPYAIYATNSNYSSDKSGFSADTLAPDGSKWTQKVSWKGATFSTNGYYRIGVINMGTFDAGDYTVSYFVKRGIDGNHNLDTLFAGTSALGSNQYHFSSEQYSPSYAAASINWVTTSGVKIEKFQNGWYRISAPLTVSSAFNPLRTGASHYVLNTPTHETYYKEHDWYYWGMQIEPGDVVTSYMGNFVGDSTNSTGERLRTQRGADCLFMDGQEFKDFYNVAESSIVMQYTLLSGSTYTNQSRPFKISAQTGSDTRIDYVNTNQYHPYIAADGSAVVGGVGLDIGNVLYNGQTNKIAIKVKHQDFASTLNGGTVNTNTSGSWPPENKMDLLTLGALNKDGGGVLKGHIQRFTYYPVGLTNNQLVTLTS